MECTGWAKKTDLFERW